MVEVIRVSDKKKNSQYKRNFFLILIDENKFFNENEMKLIIQINYSTKYV